MHTGRGLASTPTTADIVQKFAATSRHDLSGITVTVSPMDVTYDPPNRVSVRVSYTYVPYLKVFTTPPTLTVYAEGRMVVN